MRISKNSTTFYLIVYWFYPTYSFVKREPLEICLIIEWNIITNKKKYANERERERPFMARFAIAPAAILQIVSSKLLLLRSAKSDESPPASTILSWFVSAHSQHEWTFK